MSDHNILQKAIDRCHNKLQYRCKGLISALLAALLTAVVAIILGEHL